MTAYGPLAAWYDSLTEDVDYIGLRTYLETLWKAQGLSPRSVLDLACGTGTLALLLADSGYTVTGADLSEDMLTMAQGKAADLPAEARPFFVRADMADFSLPEPVDAIVCTLDSFNYLSDPAAGRAALACMYAALVDGGSLVFDINTPKKLRAMDGQLFLDETDDVVCLWRTEFDETDETCFYGMELFVREGTLWRREFEEHWEYAYSIPFLQSALAEAGFTDVHVYGDRTLQPPESDTQRVYFTARRNSHG